ncbi:unnamed protein product, partial [marine sediment metagenome]
RLKEKGYIPIDKHILSATVSERAGRWYVSILVEEDIEIPVNNGGVVGVDLGVKKLATVSDGKVFENPKALRMNERRLVRKQRSVSRKKKGSNNRRKAILELQKIHKRISDIRSDHIHKVTSYLAKTKSVIGLEDLNVSGMLKNRRLS